MNFHCAVCGEPWKAKEVYENLCCPYCLSNGLGIFAIDENQNELGESILVVVCPKVPKKIILVNRF